MDRLHARTSAGPDRRARMRCDTGRWAMATAAPKKNKPMVAPSAPKPPRASASPPAIEPAK